MERATTLALALALAGCTQTSSKPSAGFRGPEDVAVFRGVLNEHPDVLRPYAAVANGLGDELKFVDLLDGRAVLAPALVGALSVPTLQRPAILAAGSLHDVDGGGQPAAQPDLLVVASRGLVPRDQVLHPGEASARLQVVATWDPETRIAFDVDLGDVAPGEEVLSMAAVAVPEPVAGGGTRAAPGRARVLAGLTGGLLAVVDFVRGAAGAVELATPAAPAVVQALGFEPVALAGSPDATRAYVATIDPIPPLSVEGVAELDATGTPGAWALRALPAGAPTTAVAAAEVREFTGFTSDPAVDQFAPVASLRVYAALASGRCGRDAASPCGIAVLDPEAGGLRADPAGQRSAMVPMQVPGGVLGLAVAGPSAVPERAGLILTAPGSGQRWTTALLLARTSGGRVYLVDPAHFAVMTDTDLLRSSGRTRVVSALSGIPTQPDGRPQGQDKAFIGLWDERNLDGAGTAVSVSAKVLPALVGVTPGFTNTEAWRVTWQGILPGLGLRPAVLRADAAGPAWLAVQEATGLVPPAGEPLRGVARLYDPALGIRRGDLVVVDAAGLGTCDATGPFELQVTGFVPPDAARPGGALTVEAAPVQPQNPVLDAGGGFTYEQDGSLRTVSGDPACLAGASGDLAVTATIRARALVAVGSASGQAGRPAVEEPPVEVSPPFALAYEPEDSIACPILVEPDGGWPPPPDAVAACEADAVTCRADCERLVLARRARRLYYLTDRCLQGDTSCATTWEGLTFPFPAGPVVSFKVGLLDGDGNPATTAQLVRDAELSFTTANGIVPTSRQPYSGSSSTAAVLPTGAVVFDKAGASGVAADGLHGLATFVAGVVLDFAVASPAQNATSYQ